MAGVYGHIVSVETAAAELCQFTDGASPEEVAGYLQHLGGIGAGLHELLRAEQGVAGIFRVIFNLSMLTEMAVANQHNCQRLCMLGHDVLALLDNAGRRGAAVRAIGVEALTACFEDICSMVDAFTQPGWLLRMVCDGRLREEFETLHQAVLELVKGEGLLSLPGARPPVAVDYRDLGRPMRRLLKQVGSGSLTAGVQQLRVNKKSCVELARLLGVHYLDTIKAEVTNLPRSDLELNTLYHQLLRPGSASNTGGRFSDAANSRPGSRRASAAADKDGAPASGGAAGGQDQQAAAAAAGLGRDSSSNSFSLSMSGQAAAALYGDLFRWYDRNKSGALEREELQAALLDLGVLEGKSAVEVKDMMSSYMRVADAAAHSRGEGVGFEAFCRFYETLVMAKARQQLRFKLGLQVEEDLRTIFFCFAGFGSREVVTEMDSAHFLKLCRDCGLLDKHTGTTEVDLVFCYSKTKGARRITFEQFLTALSKLAERKGVAFEDAVMKVLASGGPTANATVMPEYVRLHDDKSTFTGVYARGGPSPLEDSGLDLALMVDRRLHESVKLRLGANSPSSPGTVVPVHPSRRGPMRSLGGVQNQSSVPYSPSAHYTPGSPAAAARSHQLTSPRMQRANSAGSGGAHGSSSGTMMQRASSADSSQQMQHHCASPQQALAMMMQRGGGVLTSGAANSHSTSPFAALAGGAGGTAGAAATMQQQQQLQQQPRSPRTPPDVPVQVQAEMLRHSKSPQQPSSMTQQQQTATPDGVGASSSSSNGGVSFFRRLSATAAAAGAAALGSVSKGSPAATPPPQLAAAAASGPANPSALLCSHGGKRAPAGPCSASVLDNALGQQVLLAGGGAPPSPTGGHIAGGNSSGTRIDLTIPDTDYHTTDAYDGGSSSNNGYYQQAGSSMTSPRGLAVVMPASATTPSADEAAAHAASAGSSPTPPISSSTKWFSFGLLGRAGGSSAPNTATTGSQGFSIAAIRGTGGAAAGAGGGGISGGASPAHSPAPLLSPVTAAGAARAASGSLSRSSSLSNKADFAFRDAAAAAGGADSSFNGSVGLGPYGIRSSKGGAGGGLMPRTPSGTGALGGPSEEQLKDVFQAFAGFGIRSPSIPGYAANRSPSSAGGRLSAGGRMSSSGRMAPPPPLQQQQQQDESFYATPVLKPLLLEMDGFRFVKLCRESGLFDGKDFTSTGADIIFAKVKTKGTKKITYCQFMTALSLIASLKKVPPQHIVDVVLQCGGPSVNSSLAVQQSPSPITSAAVQAMPSLSLLNSGAVGDLCRAHDSR